MFLQRFLFVSAALVAVISAKTGLPNARLWTVTITNFGPSGAASVKLSSLNLTQTSGPACTPVLAPPPFPISYGTINPNTSANGAVTIDFSSCATANRFRVDMIDEANGSATTKTLYNQFR